MKKTFIYLAAALFTLTACSKEEGGGETANSWFELHDGVNSVSIPSGKKLFTFIVNTPDKYETEPFYVVEPSSDYYMRSDVKAMILDTAKYRFRNLKVYEPDVQDVWIEGTDKDNKLDTLLRFEKNTSGIHVYGRHADFADGVPASRQDTIKMAIKAFSEFKKTLDSQCRPGSTWPGEGGPADIDKDGAISIIIYNFGNNQKAAHWEPRDYLGMTTDRDTPGSGHPHDIINLNLEVYSRSGWRRKFTVDPAMMILSSLIEEYYRLLYYDHRYSERAMGAKSLVLANSRPMLAKGAAALAEVRYNSASLALMMNTTTDEYMYQKRMQAIGSPYTPVEPYTECTSYYGDGCFFYSWLNWKYPDNNVLYNFMRITDEDSIRGILNKSFSQLYFSYLKEMVSVQLKIQLDGASGTCPFNNLGQIICPGSVTKETFKSRTDLKPGEYLYNVWDDQDPSSVTSVTVSLPAGYKAYAIYANDIL